MSGARKFGLIVFGAILVALFAGIAVAQGVSKGGVESGDIITVQDVPDGKGNITQKDFNRSFLQTWKRGGLQSAPKEGDAQYEEVREAAINDLLDQAWLTGEASELGVEANDREIDNELTTIKQQQFPTAKDFKDFLKESGFTNEEVRQRVELQVLSRKIQAEIEDSVTEVPDNLVEQAYEQQKDTQFTTQETREIELIVAGNKANADKAIEQLGDDPSDEDFAKVAKKLSVHTSKDDGGKFEVTEGSLPDPAGADIMSAEVGTLEGPVEANNQFYIFRVTKVNPEETRSLDEVRQQITPTLLQQVKQQKMADFVSAYNEKWTSRTFCADDYTVSRCDNYNTDGRLVTAEGAPLADAKCFTAGANKFARSGPGVGCPAPIALPKPMAPGGNVDSVGFGPAPTGKVQRPILPSDVATDEGGATGAAGFDPSQMVVPTGQ